MIRAIKPKFNHAGVWPGKTRFIVWRMAQNQLELSVTEVPESTWRRFGGTAGISRYLHQSLSRLLWLALNPKRSYSELPAGWAHGEFSPVAQIQCGQFSGQIEILLDLFFWKSADEFFSWLKSRFSRREHAFELRAIEADLEVMREFSNKSNPNKVPQLTLL